MSRLQHKAILLLCLFRASAVGAFPAHSLQDCRTSSTICFSTAVPRGSKPAMDNKGSSPTTPGSRIEFVDFWGTKFRDDEDDQRLVLPVDPSLDRYGGPLPPGAYQIHGNPEFDPKPNCRIALSLDWQQSQSRFQLAPLDGDLVVRQIQKCFDAGFQTFQLTTLSKKSNNMEMIGRVVRETPKFVDMHWTVRLELPKLISAASVREAVISLLSSTRMDSLDTVLVPHDAAILPQYHLEVIDALHDMQRDGYLRSIGVEDWPLTLIKQAQQYGFNLHVHQLSGNLLLPPPRSEAVSGEIRPSEWWVNPLANNFLSDNVSLTRNPPVHAKGWNDVRKWYERKHRNKQGKKETISDFDVWKVYKKDVYENLRHVSEKHEVSIAAIALRWCLQEKAPGDRNQPASSIIYPLSLVEEPEGRLAQELRGLRNVFRFGLDEEDMEILDSMVARAKPKATKIRIDEIDVPIEDIPAEFLREFKAMNGGQDEDDFMDGEEAEDYPKIDFNNPRLWL